MDANKLEETIDAINMLKELGLPVNIEQLQRLREQETKFLSENIVPQIQSQVQALCEQIHIPFCLVVDHQYGTPVQVRIAGKTNIKADITQAKSQKITGRNHNTNKAYTSSHILEAWKEFLDTLPNGNVFYKVTITQSYHSLSKLLRIMQSKEMMKYTSSLFKNLNLPITGRLTPKELKDLLEPEQVIQETSRDGSENRIVLWSQSQKTETLANGKRIKMFKEDGVTPIMVDKAKPIKEGKWTLKTLCDLIAQKEYFAQKHLIEQSK